MDVRQLEAVVSVADHAHFTRAAEAMHIAQPALSQQIRRLESELGLALFERTTPVRPTEAGERLVARARRVLAELRAAREELDELRGLTTGQLELGALQWLGVYDLPGIIAEFHGLHPGVTISLHEATTAAMLSMLHDDRLDLAVIVLDRELPAGIAAQELHREELVLVTPTGHRFAPAERVDFSALRHETFVMFTGGDVLNRITANAASDAAFTPAVGFSSDELTRVRALVSRGLGIAIIPRSAALAPGPPVASIHLRPELHNTVGIAWHEGRRRPPAAEAFLRLALERATGVGERAAHAP